MQVYGVIANALNLNVDSINSKTRFLEDLQVDSLSFIELIIAAEKEFNIKIHPNDIEHIQTVGELEDYINALQ